MEETIMGWRDEAIAVEEDRPAWMQDAIPLDENKTEQPSWMKDAIPVDSNAPPKWEHDEIFNILGKAAAEDRLKGSPYGESAPGMGVNLDPESPEYKHNLRAHKIATMIADALHQ